MDRLHYFLTADDHARRKSALLAAVSGAAVGMAMEAFGQPFETSAHAAIAVLGIVFSIRVLLYCRAAQKEPQAVAAPALIGRRLLKTAIAVGLFFTIGVVSAPMTEADVLDLSLRHLTRVSTLSSDAGDKAGNNLDLAREWGVALPNETLLRVRNSVKNTALNGRHSSGLARAANALVSYGRGELRLSAELQDVPPAARKEADKGIASLSAAVSRPNPSDLNAALQAFTRALEQSNGNRSFEARVLILRAMTNISLRNSERAAEDVRNAEALGSLDLPTISLIEGDVFANQADLEDAKRAVGLLTLALQLDPGERWDPTVYQILAYEGRCLAYVRLREFAEALPDAQNLVALAQGYDTSLRIGYRLMIVAYLGLGDDKGALNAAREYQNRVGGPVADQWLAYVENYRQNPEGVFNELYGAVTTLTGLTPTS